MTPNALMDIASTSETLTEFQARLAEYVTPTWPALIERYGSTRRLLAAYWLGELSPEAERLIEESMPKMEIAGFKPIC